MQQKIMRSDNRKRLQERQCYNQDLVALSIKTTKKCKKRKLFTSSKQMKNKIRSMKSNF